jgi:CBS domain-containing protein
VRISDVLRGKGAEVLTVAPSTPVAELIRQLSERNIGALPVVDDGRVVGIVSERDVVRQLHAGGAGVLQMKAADIMTTEVAICSPTDNAADLARVMTERRFRHLPVVVDGELVGIVSIGDLVKHKIDQLQFERDQLDSYVHQT